MTRMVTGDEVAYTAIQSGLLGTPYSKMDCQAFVEEVLKRAGVSTHNYRGSNDMWRNLVLERAPVKGHVVPVGSLAFIVKGDGGEVKRGYHDDMGNATHVAIVISADKVMESSRGGVQYGNLSRFTNYGLIKGVEYDEEGMGSPGASERPTDKQRLLNLISILKNNMDELEGAIYDIYGNS